ncbi:MAG: D-alanyl-D-alanine carboxypeptidase [Oscillospiraceae bacterium]|nr:D-alanyl-D-alanine carboxypeptidase [Oscillospiraceae bacterium]
MKKVSKYIIAILFCGVILSTGTFAAQLPDTPQMKSEAVVLMDGDTGQVLFQKNMHEKLYPASITKIMTALLALENCKMTGTITMSHDAVFSIGNDSSSIALDVGEQLTVEQALYALAIASANDAANGIAELVSGNMDDFAKLMTARAKELGALDTNFVNAHGLPDENHYTTAYDMARITMAAIKIPEFVKIFGTISYEIPPTNKQTEPRDLNRPNSMLKGQYKYDGVIAEKTGWTGDAGYTYMAVAKRGGRTLIAVVMKSPTEVARWDDTGALFDYGFGDLIQVSYSANELSKKQYTVESADGSKTDMDLIPAGDFTCLVLKSLSKDDIDVKYILTTDGTSGKIDGKAVFTLKPGVSTAMPAELGEADLQVHFDENDPVSVNMVNDTGQPLEIKKSSIISKIFAVLSVILEIIGCIAVIALILYIRRNMIIQKRKKRRLNYNKTMYK